jgi:hypothetical protein
VSLLATCACSRYSFAQVLGRCTLNLKVSAITKTAFVWIFAMLQTRANPALFIREPFAISSEHPMNTDANNIGSVRKQHIETGNP